MVELLLCILPALPWIAIGVGALALRSYFQRMAPK